MPSIKDGEELRRSLRVRELIGCDLPADELERLVRVDALLRVAARSGHHRRAWPEDEEEGGDA
jgi:hypothetical protein